jgi:hypothetical protein
MTRCRRDGQEEGSPVGRQLGEHALPASTAVEWRSGSAMTIIAAMRKPLTRFITRVTSQSLSSAPTDPSPATAAVTGHQEVLGEQLATGHQQRDEADREGQRREQLLPVSCLTTRYIKHARATSTPPRKPVARAAAESVEPVRPLLHQPVERVLDLRARRGHQGEETRSSLSTLTTGQVPPMRPTTAGGAGTAVCRGAVMPLRCGQQSRRRW